MACYGSKMVADFLTVYSYKWGDSGKNNHSGIPFLLLFNIKILMVTWYKAKYNKAFHMTI